MVSARRLAMSAVLVWVCGGCVRQMNNPFADSGAWGRAELTTPSAEGFREGHMPVAQLQRVWPKSLVYGRNGYVTHWPVWFEDPLVYKGNDALDPNDRNQPDSRFALNWVDLLAIAYGPGRMALNVVGFPVSAIVHPPGTVMVSDGNLNQRCCGYDYDSVRASPGAEPPDVTPLFTQTEVVEDVSALPPLPLPPVIPPAPTGRTSATQRVP